MARGLKVCPAMPMARSAFANALLAGVDTIEHASILDDEDNRTRQGEGRLPLHGYLQYRIHAGRRARRTVLLPESIEKEKSISRSSGGELHRRQQGRCKNGVRVGLRRLSAR